jgi:hypothetical protein
MWQTPPSRVSYEEGWCHGGDVADDKGVHLHVADRVLWSAAAAGKQQVEPAWLASSR